jgi:hypothetical protein
MARQSTKHDSNLDSAGAFWKHNIDASSTRAQVIPEHLLSAHGHDAMQHLRVTHVAVIYDPSGKHAVFAGSPEDGNPIWYSLTSGSIHAALIAINLTPSYITSPFERSMSLDSMSCKG